MTKIAVLWPNRIADHNLLEKEGAQVFENVGALTSESLTKQLLDNGFQAFVCTGGIEKEVCRATNLPVYVATSNYIDLLETLKRLETEHGIYDKQIALLLHQNNILQMERITPYLDNSVERFTFANSADIPRLLLRIKQKKMDAIVTGPTGFTLASRDNIPVFPICYSEESALDAVKQLKTLLKLSYKEMLRTRQLQSALDVSPDAIIFTDADGIITLCNQKTCEMLKQPSECILNHPVTEIMKDSSWESTYKMGIAQRGALVKVEKTTYFSTRLPVFQGNEIVGTIATFQEAEQVRSLETKFRSYQAKGLTAKYTFNDIVGTSSRLRNAIEHARIYAKMDHTILIEGETGTGKEVFAQSIHNESQRKSGPFVAINCAALTESLLESELMGYAEGAFTGAKKGGKAGLFELAHKGTLFLDEINQMSITLQSKLLRVIQERTVMRVGGDRAIPIDVRIITATNEKLQTKVRAHAFRNDLFYRINVLPLMLPPLRERKEDILPLMELFADHNIANWKTEVTRMYKMTAEYNWPGNIRELQNYVWRCMALLSCGVSLDSLDFKEYQVDCEMSKSSKNTIPVKIESLDDMEYEIINEVMKLCNGNQSQVAKLLRISRNTVKNKLKKQQYSNRDRLQKG